MKNSQIVEDFFYGYNGKHKKNKSGSVRIEGNKLFSYNTCIAECVDGICYINLTRYSNTTSRIQSLIKQCSTINTRVCYDVPRDSSSIVSYYKENYNNGTIGKTKLFE